jgi:hypothetical protein
MTVVQPAGRDAVVPAGPPVQRLYADRQPALALRGLVLVLPIAVVLAIGAGGGEGSVRVLAPIITFSLPLVVMVAFWWANWPGSRLRDSESGWADTGLIAAGAVVLTGLGQTLAGGLDPAGLFDPAPGPGHVPTFPATLPLGGAAFVVMLELTLVGEGWPLRRLRPVPGGLLAVAVSWLVAVVGYLTVVEVRSPDGSHVIARHGPVPGAELGAVLVLIGAGQVLGYVTWRGWPLTTIRTRPLRLITAHVTVLGAGVLAYVLAHRLLGFDPVRIAAVAGCFIAAGLIFGMLLEDWLARRSPRVERTALLAATIALTVVLALGLSAVARRLHFTDLTAADWVEHATLNALSTSIILHVAIGRRWPFLRPSEEVGQLT